MIARWIRNSTFWGGLLILGGLALLFQNLTGFPLGGLFWAGAFGLAGLAFLSISLRPEDPWWPLIPGCTALALAFSMLLEVVARPVQDIVGGSIVLAGIALAFLLVYFRQRSQWWAIIPAGVLATFAAVSWLDEIDVSFDTGGVFFLGLGLTFLLLCLLPRQEGYDLRWAWIPGGILTFIGLLILVQASEWGNLLWPIALVLGGAWMIFNAFRRKEE